jgi:hypothetical protein
MSAPRFITFRLKDTEKTLRNINLFYIQNSLDGIARKVKNALRLKNGTLLVEVQNDKQVAVLLKANTIASSFSMVCSSDNYDTYLESLKIAQKHSPSILLPVSPKLISPPSAWTNSFQH